jgi:hypothetical protein
MHRANFADFILDLRNCYSQTRLYIGYTQSYEFVNQIYIISFWREIGVVSGLFGCFIQIRNALKLEIYHGL